MDEERDLQIEILIVDDDQTVADILKDLLSEGTRSVDVCYDGLAAMESIQKKSYDLIIVDLIMPGVGGLDVLKCAKKINPDVIVIIITGYASVETAISAIKEGAYDYIRKPCKLEEIKIVVDNAIDKIRLNRENRKLLIKLQDAYHELMTLKEEKCEDEKEANLNVFSSSLPSLQYLYNNSTPANSYMDKLHSLSSMKENGILSENEFQAFKKHLLKRLDKTE